MADFCKQCSIVMFGEDTEDLAGLCKEGEITTALCEGCDHSLGYLCWVNYLGECLEPGEPVHVGPWKVREVTCRG